MVFLIEIIFAVASIAGLWAIFGKAGQPGWHAIIPILNVITLLKVVGRPLWWLVLAIIPIVNIVFAAIICGDLAKSFRKSTGYAVGLFFLAFIFYPMLGFGPDTYAGPAGSGGVV